jgi:hypothetical protein
VHRLESLQGSNWDRLLPAYPQHTVFHTSHWVRVLAQTYGFHPLCFVLERQSGPQGVVPVMEVDSWVTGRRGVSLPFTDDCPPLVKDERACDCLFQAVSAYGRSRGWKYLELRGGKDLLPGATASRRYYGHQVNLCAGEAELFASLRGSVRQAVRKAKRLGLKAELSQDLEAVQTFYSLHCRTRLRKHGLPPQPFSFFRNIQQHILSAGHGLVLLVRQGTKAVAGGMFFHEGSQATYKFGASDEQSLGSRGNNLAMWTAMTHFARAGMTTLDFGRTSLAEEGLRRFKLSFGASERLIEYVRVDLGGNRFVSCGDEVGGYSRVFRLVPVWLGRLLGALLYRHVG